MENAAKDRMTGNLIREARRAYCTMCDGRDMRIVMTIRVRCANCGKTKMVQRKMEPEYGR